MKTWNEYKEHIKNTDNSAQKDLEYAEEQAHPTGSFISSWKGSKLCPTHVHR